MVLASLPEMLQTPWISMTGRKKAVAGTAMGRSEDLRFLAELAVAGSFKPVIDRCYPFEQMAEAHRYVDTGHKRGNVVITVAKWRPKYWFKNKFIMNNGSLTNVLKNLLLSGTTSNPALNRLLSDYTTYHVVLLIVGGLFTLILLTLSILFWAQYQRASKTNTRNWTFETKTYFSFSLLTTLAGLLMVLIVVANATNVLSPRQGFSGLIDEFGTSPVGTHRAELHQSFNTWLKSGDTNVPSLIQSKINDRLEWQRPKAIICTVLLAIFVRVSIHIWGRLIRKSKVRETQWKPQDKALLFSGCCAVAGCLLLMLMVLGNTQGTFAPMSLTLFFG
jgi:hypothetical protein